MEYFWYEICIFLWFYPPSFYNLLVIIHWILFPFPSLHFNDRILALFFRRTEYLFGGKRSNTATKKLRLLIKFTIKNKRLQKDEWLKKDLKWSSVIPGEKVPF
jgi:hypothetical protein